MKKTTEMAEVLVELSDPTMAAEFEKDPDAYLSGKNLAAVEKQALVARNSNSIRFYARGISEKLGGDNTEFLTKATATLAVDVVEVIEVVEVVVVAEESYKVVYTDRQGNLFILAELQN